jgi:hypothetical protein
MDSPACPSQVELARFAVGDVPQAVFARMSAHVLECPRCEAALQQLEAVKDPLVSELRSLGQDLFGPPIDVPERALEAAKKVRPGESSAVPEPRPRHLGKFELLEELGIGSFGHVFRARDTQLDQIVAIKFLRAGRFSSREDEDRFLRGGRVDRLHRPGARIRPSTRHRPSRHQAVQHHDRQRRPAALDGLRPGQVGRR